jgi:hypothetical protein
LIKPDGVSKKELGVYRDTMLPDDVAELLCANLSRLEFQRIETANLRPVPFGAAAGFRFDLAFSTKDGLLMKGTAIAAQRGGKLDLILFIAPDEYYYGHYSEVVDRIFSSIQAG